MGLLGVVWCCYGVVRGVVMVLLRVAMGLLVVCDGGV